MNQEIKGIAFDFGGVLGQEKDIVLDPIDQKLELKFGNLNTDNEFLNWAIKETGLGKQEIINRAKNIIFHFYEIAEPDLLNNFQNYQLALATNHLSYLTDWLKEINYLKNFQTIFSSALVGKEKPNQDYFELLAKTMNLNPNQILFIDDNQKNVDSANSVGFKSVLYQRKMGNLKNLIPNFINLF